MRCCSMLPLAAYVLAAMLVNSPTTCSAAALVILSTPHDDPFRRPDDVKEDVKRRFLKVEQQLLPSLVKHGKVLREESDMEQHLRPSPLPGGISIASIGMLPSYEVQFGESTTASIFPNKHGPPAVAIYFRIDDELDLAKGRDHRRAWEEKKLAELIEWIEALPRTAEKPEPDDRLRDNE